MDSGQSESQGRLIGGGSGPHFLIGSDWPGTYLAGSGRPQALEAAGKIYIDASRPQALEAAGKIYIDASRPQAWQAASRVHDGLEANAKHQKNVQMPSKIC